MKNKRNLYKKKNKFFTIIENHINQNCKEYIIATLVFFIGIVIGIIIINFSNNENRTRITGYINEFVKSIKSGEYGIDGKAVLIKSIFTNLKIACIIWIAGSTIIGIPVVYFVLGYKGFCIGYSISAVMATLGNVSGLIFCSSTMLIKNIIEVPCLLALAVSSVKMYKAVIKKYDKSNIKSEICRHTFFSMFATIGLMISSVLECFFTSYFFSNIIIKFI